MPFRYSLDILARNAHYGKSGAEKILLDEIRMVLQSKLVATGLKLHHLFVAADCSHEETLRELIRVEDDVVNSLGYEHLLDLIKSREDATKLLIEVIEQRYPYVAQLLRSYCSSNIDELENSLMSCTTC